MKTYSTSWKVRIFFFFKSIKEIFFITFTFKIFIIFFHELRPERIWTEAVVSPPSCPFSVVSIQKLENMFLVSSIFHLISLFKVVIFQLFHSITSFKSCYPIHFLCSFVSSIQQFSFHLETAVSTAFFFHFWWKRFHCDSKLFYRS